MNVGIRTLVVTVFLLLPKWAIAQAAMEYVDLIVDAPNLVGKQVTVACQLSNASVRGVICSKPGQADNFHLRLAEPEDTRRTLRDCASFDDKPECRAEATGIVRQSSSGRFEMQDVRLQWMPR